VRSPTRYAVLVAVAIVTLRAHATIPLEHFAPPIASLASSSDLIVIATVPVRDAAADGTVAVEIEEVWKGTAPGSARVIASAPWMSTPWRPQPGERFLLFLQASGPAQPYRLLDLGASHFRVVPFSPPVVDVWPGLLPGTILAGASCRLVGSLNPDGTITYKKVCTGSFTAPLSSVREAVGLALRSSVAGVPPA